jgi:hypothetical protein
MNTILTQAEEQRLQRPELSQYEAIREAATEQGFHTQEARLLAELNSEKEE